VPLVRAAAVVALGLALSAGVRNVSDTVDVIVGLDHVPIAVSDLDAAAERFRALGFTLKPGTFHDDGIRNQHAKFPDGTELELITAPEARDALTSTYRRHLAQGDGPAFLALYAPDRGAVAARLDEAHLPYRRDRVTVDFQTPDPLAYIFFSGRNQSPTDRPEHFAHANTAESLIAVWLAGDRARERALLRTLGVDIVTERVRAPEPMMADVAHLPEGDLVFLPADRAVVAGRPVVGATLRVRSLAAARQLLDRTPWRSSIASGGRSAFVPPAVAHGLWLEFREIR
jgi:catechol 2,3-dioxygenase-like lactoylglutathione lyase family enzyme